MTGFIWGTVASVAPVRVRLDGDSSAVPIDMDSLIDPLTLVVGDRVRVERSDKRLVIHGRSGGVALDGVPSVSSADARNAAITSPQAGMRVYRTDKGWVEQYLTTGLGVAVDEWYPVSGLLPTISYRRAAGFSWSTTDTKLSWDTVIDSDPTGTITYAAPDFTVAVAGVYRVTAAVGLQTTTSYANVSIRRGSTQIRRRMLSGSSANWQANEVSALVKCAAGDTLSAYIVAGAAITGVAIDTSYPVTTIDIEYVRPA